MRALAALVVVLVFAPVASAATLNITLDHRSVGVGDPFRYMVTARGDSTLKVIADTGPFAVVAAPKISRSHSGGQTVVRIEQTLACLDRGCAPGKQPRSVLLPAARAVGPSGTVTAPAAAITLVPRVPASAVAASRAVYRRQVEVAPASTPVSPGLAAALLATAAVLLLALASLLTWLGLRRRDALPVRDRIAGGLERALRLLRESAGRPVPDRRRAADYAGRAAAALGGAQVAGEASRIAWAPPDPEPADVGALAEHIESAVGSGQ
ncbi:MAG TPA: hypothetical protein VNH45_11780 [Gaiellaceae bacterium]|nr:hypothetical protein [Gaiellaceae bacterium]